VLGRLSVRPASYRSWRERGNAVDASELDQAEAQELADELLQLVELFGDGVHALYERHGLLLVQLDTDLGMEIRQLPHGGKRAA
jgi:hypothetical protein